MALKALHCHTFHGFITTRQVVSNFQQPSEATCHLTTEYTLFPSNWWLPGSHCHLLGLFHNNWNQLPPTTYNWSLITHFLLMTDGCWVVSRPVTETQAHMIQLNIFSRSQKKAVKTNTSVHAFQFQNSLLSKYRQQLFNAERTFCTDADSS